MAVELGSCTGQPPSLDLLHTDLQQDVEGSGAQSSRTVILESGSSSVANAKPLNLMTFLTPSSVFLVTPKPLDLTFSQSHDLTGPIISVSLPTSNLVTLLTPTPNLITLLTPHFYFLSHL
ncbi:hypothetical protein RRG08_044011 [Elysia crispata]|uniref:Uncharacterized protein n=1 Tax=Elysia crispata TaxID=231223 RepID=A0AAE0Y1E3_9GAST|nr:hypothetical protein RRG08_044011 [Elysia crispata]